jgi:hypothetical protein
VLRWPSTVVIFVSEAGATCYRRAGTNETPRLFSQVPIEKKEDVAQSSPDALSAIAAETLSELFGQLAEKIKSAKIEIVLSWSLAPGCVVDLGDGTLPGRIREELAKRRLADLFSLDFTAWRARLQTNRVAGPALAFAIQAALADTIARASKETHLKVACVLPALIWTFSRYRRGFDDGWWVVQGDHRLLVADVRQGICRSVDAAPDTDSGVEPAPAVARAVQRTAWLRGSEASNNRLRLIRLSRPFEFDTLSLQIQASEFE